MVLLVVLGSANATCEGRFEVPEGWVKALYVLTPDVTFSAGSKEGYSASEKLAPALETRSIEYCR
jgi:hypothetical protein